MRTFISDYVVNLAAPYHSLTNLFKLQFSQTYYFTSFAQTIPYDSQWWLPKGIKFDQSMLSMSGGVDSLDLEFQNQDKWFSNLCLAENIVGKPVYIYQTALDNNNQVIASELIFYGYGDKRQYHQERGVFTVKNHMAIWRKQTPPLHSVACRWEFKEKADEVIGTDVLNYRCIVDHPASAANRPITGAYYASFWQQIGNSGVTWVADTEYQAGTCKFAGRYLPFTGGGAHVIAVGETIVQGGASAYLEGVWVDSGAWASGNVVGVLSFRSQVGTFAAGVLAIGADSDVATITADSIAPADFACDHSTEACKKYGNRDNFGGNMWLPWIEDPGNQIWFGRNPALDPFRSTNG
jgi:hypothetical protein